MKPLRKGRLARGQTTKVTVLPAPTAGWYVGDNQAEAPPKTAWVMDNVFPQLDYVRSRRGSSAWATGMGAFSVFSLMTWTNGTLQKMFAACNNKIYEVSSQAAVGAALVSGLTSSSFESILFTGTGGSWIIAVNGSDPAQLYNGTAWVTAPAITGLTGNNLSQVWSYKNRVYGVEANSTNAWYLPLDSIGGAAIKFPLSSIFKLGGKLLVGATWAIDANSGMYESCVFISTEGEVAMYNGDYPGAANWNLQGTYKISKPLGVRCLMKAGGDLAVMTEDGIVAMSKVQVLDQIALQNVAVTKPIAPAWRSAVVARTGLSGWQIVVWPLESMGIVNLPKTSANDYQQYVANVRTGAWSRYVGWDANCFCVFNNLLYYGTSDGRVLQAEIGGADDSTNQYTSVIGCSYSALDAPGQSKIIDMVISYSLMNYQFMPTVNINVDFDQTIPAAPSFTSNLATGALWDVALWDVDVWGGGVSNYVNNYSVTGIGDNISLIWSVTYGVSTFEPDVRLASFQIFHQDGNVFG